jgi:hypothetical protein
MTAITASAKKADTAGMSKIHTGLPLVKTVMGTSYWLVEQSKQPHIEARANYI